MWRSLWKRTSSLWLALITCLLVSTVIPVMAKPTFVTTEPTNLIQQGLNFYEQGMFSEAATAWQTAAQSSEDNLKKSLSLSYLSLAQQELGQWQAAEKNINESIQILQTQPRLDAQGMAILAKTLNHQALLQLATGKTETALATWQEAEKQYTTIADKEGILGSQINQAQALQTLGLYHRAQKTLETVQQTINSQPDSLLKVKSLLGLGVALELSGNLKQSQTILKQTLELAKRFNSPADITAIFLSLGNTSSSLQDGKAALDYYQQALSNAPNQILKLEAQLHQLQLLIDGKQWLAVEKLIPTIKSNLIMDGGREAIYAQINFSDLLLQYQKNTNGSDSQLIGENAKLLANSIQQAQKLGDRRAQSYASGELGKLYQFNQQWLEAEQLTEKALKLAQGINASEIAYQWQWQMGKIVCRDSIPCNGDRQKAITSYSEAVNLLKDLRGDLVASKLDVQFSFRESVEPIYRELVELLLASAPGEQEISQKNLKEAREVIENLQLAELDNFFRRACLKAQPELIDKVDPTAAVIYPIVLANRISVIVSLPNQPLQYFETKVEREKVETTVDKLIQTIHPTASSKQRLTVSKQLYDWLILPEQTQLAESKVQTLVFVLDGLLQNLPIGALHDGQKYLIESYSVALTPGLQLLEPQALTKDKIKVLAGGLSQASQGFVPLPGVEPEIQQIANSISSEVILNQKFTNKNLQDKLEELQFPIVHLATHGQFSSKRDDTFILTWDNRINVNELDRILRTREQINTIPIQLLVLSACQTAAGDKRAALGLAGVAVQSGARSTLATLWSVNDSSTTKMMTEFYQQLEKGQISKAEAVRQAQLFLLKNPEYQHPFYWAPFVLVGNWL